MKPALWFAVVAMLIACVTNVILEMKIRHVSAWLLLFVTDVICLLVASVFLLTHGVDERARPHGGGEWFLIIFRGVLVSFGAYCFFLAFNRGVGMMNIVTILSLTPVLSALLLALLGGGWPSLRQWIGVGLAVFAVWLVVGGRENIPP